MSLVVYRALTTAAAPVVRAYLGSRITKGKEDGARIGERMGLASIARPDGPLVWIHAASVGESLSMLSVLDRLLSERPSIHVLFTTGTVSSARLLTDRLPARVSHQFVPVDRAAWVRRFLDYWRPNLALWVESELWPNLLMETRARNVPLILMNARMSARSYRGWKRFSGAARDLLRCFEMCMAQSDDVAQRLRELGATLVLCPGNLKHAAEPLPADDHMLVRLTSEIGGRPVWLAASTHPGEEDVAGEAHRRAQARHPDLLTLIAPRHPARGGMIAETLRAQGYRLALRSRGEPIAADTEIYIADSIGELGLFYRLAKVVFVGGSLVPHGGQNPLEPARLDCAVLFGPRMDNFRQIADELQRRGAAAMVTGADEMADEVLALMENAALLERRTAAARSVAEQKSEILDTVFDALRPYLEDLAGTCAAPLRHART